MPNRFLIAALAAVLVTPALAKDPAPKPGAADTKPAVTAPGDDKAAKTPSAGQTAARERQKQCGAQWRALSATEKTAQGPKWPQYWSKCNARLKGGSGAKA